MTEEQLAVIDKAIAGAVPIREAALADGFNSTATAAFLTAIKMSELLREEVRRLRGLVKDAEGTEREGGHVGCPWCDSSAYYAEKPAAHFKTCPAFTPEGELR